MSRPYVSVASPNRLQDLRRHLEATFPRFTALDGLAGITLNGGMSRGYADELSEVDLTFYLTPEAYTRWERGEIPIPGGITLIDGQLYDLKICSLAREQEADWSEVARWDASYAEILFDPRGLIAELYAKRLTGPAAPGGYLFSAWWHYRLAGDIWIHRGDGLQAHAILNRAIEPLASALFLANREHVPHEKWLLHMSRTLAWKPSAWEERLAQAITVAEPTIRDAVRRQGVIDGLWQEIDRHIVQTYYAGLPVSAMQKGFYDRLKWLADRGDVSLAEWLEQASLDFLRNAPFSACVTVAGDRVMLDRARMAAVRPSDMYVWHYQVLAAVRENLPGPGA